MDWTLQKIKVGTVYDRIHDAITSGAKVIINKGGTGSGKSEDTMRWVLQEALNESLTGNPVENQVLTVTSESFPHLDVGTIRMLENICSPMGLWGRDNWNKSKSVWTSPRGNNKIEFLSADRIGKALGARRYLLYGNEINNLKLDVWDEMARRSKFITGDFNPTAQFWLEDWIANYDDSVVITSNYLDNPFLPATEKQRIKKRADRDKNFHAIHVLCNYGTYEGLVFDTWYQVDELPEGDATYGLDFGFNHPAALVKTIETEDAFYFDEQFYQTGLINARIISKLEQLGIRKNYDEIIADSAEPKSIEEIYQAGYNIDGAMKGADSIRAGINRMKSKNIYITKRSTNLIKEFRNYSWAIDKNGNPTDKPVDEWNHGIDACRYSLRPAGKFQFAIK